MDSEPADEIPVVHLVLYLQLNEVLNVVLLKVAPLLDPSKNKFN